MLGWLLENIFLFLIYMTVFFVLYQTALAFIYFFARPPELLDTDPTTRFLILIPSYNEELLIAGTVKDIYNQDYPMELYEIIVIADNCTDNTASEARNAGARCLQRFDPINMSKGFSLNWFFENNSIIDYDAVVIIDADTCMQRDFLKQMNNNLSQGKSVVQGYNDLSNPFNSILTRLIYVTSVLKNLLFFEAKSRIGLSPILMGTGMVLSTDILIKRGWSTFSLGEDGEYYAKLIADNIKIHFAVKARTFAQEAVTFKQGYTQRLRWSGGKFRILYKYGFPLLWRGIKNSNFYIIDASLNLIAPNYSQLLSINLILLILSIILQKPWCIFWLGLMLLFQGLYFMAGLIVSKAGLRTWISVLIVPVYLVWKTFIDILSLFGYKNKKWIRTERTED